MDEFSTVSFFFWVSAARQSKKKETNYAEHVQTKNLKKDKNKHKKSKLGNRRNPSALNAGHDGKVLSF